MKDEILDRLWAIFEKWQKDGINDDNQCEMLKEIQTLIEDETEKEKRR